MAAFIESQRLLFEEIDSIEQALSKRFKKYPNLILSLSASASDANSSSGSTNKTPHKESLLQQHELKILQNNYKKQCISILNNKSTNSELFDKNLELINDPSQNFKNFDNLINDTKLKHEQSTTNDMIDISEDINKVYAMYSSAPNSETKVTKNGKHKVKRKYILSLVASHINLDEMFNTTENYGRYFDLTSLFDDYKMLMNDYTITYVEFLSTFDKFPYENINRKSPTYINYVYKLWNYLVKFHEKLYPLQTIDDLVKDLEKNFDPSLVMSNNDVKHGEANENGEVYCAPCNKLFAKESVYKGHLNGKKHKKNSKDQEIINDNNSSKKNNDDNNDHKNNVNINDILLIEFKIIEICKKLSHIKQATISNNERRAALTDRERMLENLNTMDGEDSAFTTIDSSDTENNDSNDSDSEDEYNSKDLPIGLDGKPMPYWLYKLQGLNQSYDCEICGNINYKGRSLFAKHFGGSKHQYGLKCLGIPDDQMSLFKNIVKINDAMDLWKRLKKGKRLQDANVENAVEVEDDDGNVMSERDYLELKRQGLL